MEQPRTPGRQERRRTPKTSKRTPKSRKCENADILHVDVYLSHITVIHVHTCTCMESSACSAAPTDAERLQMQEDEEFEVCVYGGVCVSVGVGMRIYQDYSIPSPVSVPLNNFFILVCENWDRYEPC